MQCYTVCPVVKTKILTSANFFFIEQKIAKMAEVTEEILGASNIRSEKVQIRFDKLNKTTGFGNTQCFYYKLMQYLSDRKELNRSYLRFRYQDLI